MTRVHGSLTDTAGRPLAGALTLWLPDPPVTRVHHGHIIVPAVELVRAGPDGALELAVAPGGYHVVVSCTYGGSVSVLRALVPDVPECDWDCALAHGAEVPMDGRQLTLEGAREVLARVLRHPAARGGRAWAP